VPGVASAWHSDPVQWYRVGSQVLSARFPKTRRLLTSTDYSRVFDKAEAKASHKYLLLLARRNDRPGHRLGLVIAKKNVRLAVQRNRIKRLAREFFRTLPESEPAMDVVLLTRRGIDQLENAELSSILQQQWQKLSRYIPEPEADHSQDR
jgi:ribonuclease P protein component